MFQDIILILMITTLAGFILNYFCCSGCSYSAKLTHPKERSKYTQGVYRNGVYRQNPQKFVKEGAEERIRRRMRK